MIVSRSRTPDPPQPDLLINNIPISTCDSFKLLGVMHDSKFTFEDHIRSISSSIAQKIGILRKSYKVFGEQDILKNCFNAFILPCFEYCAPVWSSAANSYFNLLDKNLRAIKFLIPYLMWICGKGGQLALYAFYIKLFIMQIIHCIRICLIYMPLNELPEMH